jgi:RNA polymerase sigma-70 factor (ECF subfamily)
MAEKDDEALLAAIQDGDGQAFTCLIKRHASKYYSLAYRILRHREGAEDIVQEAFLRIWSNPVMWDQSRKAKFTSWFYRVVVNLCLDQHKRPAGINIDDVPEVMDTAPGTEEGLIAREEERQLLTAIRNLPPRQQMAIQLFYYDALPQGEAAAAMQINLKAYQSLLQRARQALIEGAEKNQGEKPYE